eukprot:364524-Chlamydomonas_euryale.AAC.7
MQPKERTFVWPRRGAPPRCDATRRRRAASACASIPFDSYNGVPRRACGDRRQPMSRPMRVAAIFRSARGALCCTAVLRVGVGGGRPPTVRHWRVGVREARRPGEAAGSDDFMLPEPGDLRAAQERLKTAKLAAEPLNSSPTARSATRSRTALTPFARAPGEPAQEEIEVKTASQRPCSSPQLHWATPRGPWCSPLAQAIIRQCHSPPWGDPGRQRNHHGLQPPWSPPWICMCASAQPCSGATMRRHSNALTPPRSDDTVQ